MAENLILETIGSISKEEKLKTVDYKIIPGTFVLETQDPFPGYLHNDPNDKKPNYLFLMTKNYYTREDIARASKKVRQYFPHSFDAAAVQIWIYNDKYAGIRIKDLNDYELIYDLQQCFKNEGIKFRKFKNVDDKGIIEVKKFFVLKDIDVEHISFDQVEPYFTYIEIPKQLSWKLFESITYKIKNNWDFKDFDAAIGMMFKGGEAIDMVRIYCKNLTLDQVKLIRDKYYSAIEEI